MPVPVPSSPTSLLSAMVGFNTVNSAVSGNMFAEVKLAEYLEDLARHLGFATRRLPVPGRSHNLLLTWTTTTDAPWLLFDSHLDTVTIDGMTIDPLAAEVRGGRLYGRGSCDTKGTGAAMLWALREYAESERQPNNVALLYSVDEEFGMSGVRAFIERHYGRLGFEPRGVIVGEPTLLRPIVAHNGAVRWRIATTGVAAHSSDPSRGISAIRKMVDVISAIEREYIPSLTRRHALTGKAQCSINVIRGGQQINVVPDHCAIDVDRRVVPGERSEDVLPAVQAILDRLTAADPTLRATQTPIFACPPLAPSHDSSLLTAVQAVLDDMGLPTDPLGGPFATDGGDLATTGLPVVVIGPGDIMQAHTRDEWIALEQLQRGVELYGRLMRADLGVGGA
jgi:acetylornithine deacetylase